MPKRRPLTAYEKATAERLMAIWETKKQERRFTQTEARTAMGICAQSSISQFLNGVMPLSTDAKLRFAKFLGVSVLDFDPEFKDNMAAFVKSENQGEVVLAMLDLDNQETDQLMSFIASLKNERHTRLLKSA